MFFVVSDGLIPSAAVNVKERLLHQKSYSPHICAAVSRLANGMPKFAVG